ncbi:IS5 family transposase [Methylomicrobium lacus]|uniref:IS5 family transposase n=1 Tax=Methylomicrobium lacus TaxID=136992 RepID=UPI0035A932F1
MKRSGRPAKITAGDLEILKELTAEKPTATLEELVKAFQERTSRCVHGATLRKALTAAGIQRIKPAKRSAAIGKTADAKLKRYGYQERHRQPVQDERYASSLTDAEWALVQDLFEPEGGRGVPEKVSRRTMVDACCYVVRTGCAWRLLPKDFPHWDNVYKTFRRWSAQGRFEAMHDRLRQMWRVREGREEEPSAAVLDAQSTRSSPQGGPSGYDAGKKVKGRKRNLVVDTLGLVLAISVCAASLQDRDAGTEAIARAAAKYPTVQRLFVDSAYAGQWAATVQQQHGVTVEVVRHPANRNVGRWAQAGQHDLFPETLTTGFTVLPKRWVVERTHAWNERARRLIMHHDRLTDVSEAWVWLAEARILASRLTG